MKGKSYINDHAWETLQKTTFEFSRTKFSFHNLVKNIDIV